ncbi:hypothetical protein H8K90_09485 [Winogradskyella echinorum]|uniref:LTXXQ motif family protein n=1 Tax=Winogradskyella echinorum TaxID=538189 RepID=A0ABR6Y1I3_9FLAO|nr:hypothetical protein [Winogradskyella echinorum]MBC3846610.1 hypothetical protein [Winogradskyella echinorum]MBC5750958.1 hypothetical protein [Winogradskyella echinorum]
MKKSILIVFAILLGLNVYSQIGRNMNDRIPRTTREPTEKDIAKRDRMVKERKDKFIANFLTTLEADDFQKEIIKQYLNSFSDAKIAIFKTKFEHTLDREAAIKKLEETHFVELKELISEGDMDKIKVMITGGFDEKEVEKENKKKKKRKKKKKSKKDEG